jgi:methylthioribose-1-phosphate isomerase
MWKMYLIVAGLLALIIGGLFVAFKIELNAHEADLQKIATMKTEIETFKTTLDTMRKDAVNLKTNQDALNKSLNDVRVKSAKQKNAINAHTYTSKSASDLQKRINAETQKALRDLEGVSNP